MECTHEMFGACDWCEDFASSGPDNDPENEDTVIEVSPWEYDGETLPYQFAHEGPTVVVGSAVWCVEKKHDTLAIIGVIVLAMLDLSGCTTADDSTLQIDARILDTAETTLDVYGCEQTDALKARCFNGDNGAGVDLECLDYSPEAQVYWRQVSGERTFLGVIKCGDECAMVWP